MISSLHIRNLRGIQRLDVEGLGRVNLVIGRNESGKTTLLAAAGFQRGPGAWNFIAPYLDDPRGGALDLERQWLPLFRGADSATAIQVWSCGPEGDERGWRVSLTQSRGRWGWPVRLVADPGGGEEFKGNPDVEMEGLLFDPDDQSSTRIWWMPAFVEAEETLQYFLLELYKLSRMEGLLAPLRELNPSLRAIEVAGEHVYVRLEGYPLPLRVGVLGDGARRLLELATAMATDSVETLLIDELENGLHHTTLAVAMRMLQSDARQRQVFATTHRDELIRVACEVFLERRDDGLRVIRLDRAGAEHRAVVYTAEEALAAMDSGLELRG